MNPAAEDDTNGSEERLRGYLEELGDDPPRPDRGMSERIVHKARWQQAVREPLQVIGLMLAALTEGLADLLGGDRGSRR